jgi:hypothetical protein
MGRLRRSITNLPAEPGTLAALQAALWVLAVAAAAAVAAD